MVIRINYDDARDFVEFKVTDAESGDIVYSEWRNVADLTSDVTRMAKHFQEMLSDAMAIKVAKDSQAEEIQAKAQEQARRRQDKTPIWQSCQSVGE